VRGVGSAGASLALFGPTAAAGPVRGREQGGPLPAKEIPMRASAFGRRPARLVPQTSSPDLEGSRERALPP